MDMAPSRVCRRVLPRNAGHRRLSFLSSGYLKPPAATGSRSQSPATVSDTFLWNVPGRRICVSQKRGEPILIDLAVSFCRPAEASRRHSGCTMERAHEVREIAESNFERHVCDRLRAICQELRRVSQPRTDQVLVRGHTENACKEAQEVKGADSGLPCYGFEIDWLVRVPVHPQRRFHGAAAIVSPRFRALWLPRGGNLDETGGEEQSYLVEADVAPGLGRRLRQLAQHHQLGQRRHAATLPDPGLTSDRFHKLRRKMKGQTLVSGDVVVRTHILDSGIPGQNRPGNQLERFTTGAIHEAALSHVGDREFGVPLDERLVSRSRAAPVV